MCERVIAVTLSFCHSVVQHGILKMADFYPTRFSIFGHTKEKNKKLSTQMADFNVGCK